MSNYKTPGVYVEEISTFPPSVAEVETAIPAFIGYTEKGPKDEPTLINSFLEYENLFGGAVVQPFTIKLSKEDDKLPISVHFDNGDDKPLPYIMHAAVELFYANGGGKCYIVSVGNYEDSNKPSFVDFTNGLEKIKEYEDITLVVVPEAPQLDSMDQYSLYDSILSHCSGFNNRFGIFDLRSDDTDATDFRSGIGTSYLDRGAAYFPYLKTSLGYRYADNQIKFEGENLNEFLKDLTLNDLKSTESIEDELEFLQNVFKLQEDFIALEKEVAESDYSNLNSAGNNELKNYLSGLIEKVKPVKDEFQQFYENSKNLLEELNDESFNLDEYFSKIQGLIEEGEETEEGAPDPTKTDLIEYIESLLGIMGIIVEKEDPIGAEEPIGAMKTAMQNIIDSAIESFKDIIPGLKGLLDSNSGEDNQSVDNQDTNNQDVDSSDKDFLKYKGINSLVDFFLNRITSKFIAEVYNILNKQKRTLPPSPAIAGIYARVDADRGVWKAPANVSLNRVIGPEKKLSLYENDNLNIHQSGKSVNAIRAFTGRGTLVWGARTLDGNSNEWKYISVRRLFCMVEESCKLASSQFVFEPNDANTWVKVKAMIENYLTLLWRAGALMGATPDKAFFVHVGLGVTMTEDDVNNGKMIVEIGMAAVRPAEFIILRFSHKMLEN